MVTILAQWTKFSRWQHYSSGSVDLLCKDRIAIARASMAKTEALIDRLKTDIRYIRLRLLRHT